jgi:hypothetical protein
MLGMRMSTYAFNSSKDCFVSVEQEKGEENFEHTSMRENSSNFSIQLKTRLINEPNHEGEGGLRHERRLTIGG